MFWVYAIHSDDLLKDKTSRKTITETFSQHVNTFWKLYLKNVSFFEIVLLELNHVLLLHVAIGRLHRSC